MDFFSVIFWIVVIWFIYKYLYSSKDDANKTEQERIEKTMNQKQLESENDSTKKIQQVHKNSEVIRNSEPLSLTEDIQSKEVDKEVKNQFNSMRYEDLKQKTNNKEIRIEKKVDNTQKNHEAITEPANWKRRVEQNKYNPEDEMVKKACIDKFNINKNHITGRCENSIKLNELKLKRENLQKGSVSLFDQELYIKDLKRFVYYMEFTFIIKVKIDIFGISRVDLRRIIDTLLRVAKYKRYEIELERFEVGIFEMSSFCAELNKSYHHVVKIGFDENKYIIKYDPEDYYKQKQKEYILRRDVINKKIYTTDSKHLRDSIEQDRVLIKEEIKQRGITKLVHFTNMDNLESILNRGVQSRLELERNTYKFTYNDEDRFDKKLNCTSISIEYPNSKVFYAFRNRHINCDWVVLEIIPSLLYEHNGSIHYCSDNAANAGFRSQLANNELRTYKDFKDMFADEILIRKSYTIESIKRDKHINKSYPTSDQAEILVGGIIHTSFINKVCFTSNIDQQRLSDFRMRFPWIKFEINMKYLQQRP